MSIKDTALRNALRRVGKKRMPDYREKLSKPSPRREGEGEATHAANDAATRVRRLKEDPKSGSLAFQSVVVAAIEVLSRQLKSEYEVASEAISLKQRERSNEMVQSVERTIDALTELLSSQGHKMLGMRGQASETEASSGSWSRSLENAHHVCSQNTEWMQSLVAGQPEGGPARELASIITGLLQQHNSEFVGEAEQLHF